ncbi:MAG: asparagine synthase-related protein [Pseudomonadota bacterium]
MIIAGIYGKTAEQNDLYQKLCAATKHRIKTDLTYFECAHCKIIVGKTSAAIDQGKIIKTNNCLLIGKVFKNTTHEKITPQEMNSIASRSNETFTQRYWGNYLLIKIDPSAPSCIILRDPIGQLPFFYTTLSNDNVLFSSEISLLYEVTKERPSFNWSYFSSFLTNAFITSKETAFQNIQELNHGCQLHLSFDGIKEMPVWNPTNFPANDARVCCNSLISSSPRKRGSRKINKLYFANCSKNLDCNNPATHLDTQIVETLTAVMQSWLQDSKDLFLDFSGGLDSSALLFVLHSILASKQTLHPVNIFHPEVKSSDERIHAQRITQKIGVPLIEFDSSKSLPLDPCTHHFEYKPNFPTSGLTHLKKEHDYYELSKHHSNVAFISGHGGDHIFLAQPIPELICDCFLQKGLNPAKRKFLEIAAHYRCSSFTLFQIVFKNMLAHLFRHSYAQNRCIRFNQKTPWFTEKLRSLSEQITKHPSLETLKHQMPGQFRKIETIYEGLASIKGPMRDPQNPVFYPLFSQPMLELALGIPSYRLFENNFDRYPFRKAVSDAFQTQSVFRHDKGETSGVMQRGLIKNQKYILELCLDGRIVKEGLANKERLYRDLKLFIGGYALRQWPLSNLIAAELFFNEWK